MGNKNGKQGRHAPPLTLMDFGDPEGLRATACSLAFALDLHWDGRGGRCRGCTFTFTVRSGVAIALFPLVVICGSVPSRCGLLLEATTLRGLALPLLALLLRESRCYLRRRFLLRLVFQLAGQRGCCA